MKDATEQYAARTPRSRNLFQRSEKLIPGGICHGLRFFPPYPFYARSAKGSRIWDVDGNEYLDFWMGHFALILGHAHPEVVQELQEQIAYGVHWGTVNDLELDLAEVVGRLMPCAEAVRFCNTGAEATMYAVRVARGFTGRNTILKAEGGWHGFCTDLMVAVHAPFGKAESLGLPYSLEREVRTFPFNDTEAAVEAIRGAEDLAAVIVEPVLGAGGAIPADAEFLKALREETEARDALLIFDEVITGFRLALGGAQESYGVVPDMATLGKILGGGLPIGAIAGRREVLEVSNPRRPRQDRVSIGGGTFSGNPLSMRAGLITLTYLERHRERYADLDRMGSELRRELPRAFKDGGVGVVCTGTGSIFQVHFPFEEGLEIRSARDVYERTDHRRREEEMKLRLINEGIYTVHGGGCLSLAHSKEDVKTLLKAASTIATDMGRHGDA